MTQQTVEKPQPRSPEQVQYILTQLAELYPNARYDLDFSTPLELLVATILAAQCTDERVNATTRSVFQKYQNAADYLAVPQEELENDLKSITFYRNKTKYIRNACQYLIDNFAGIVPQTMSKMVRLPGVARKTANVILGSAFGVVEGVIVDTHVLRLAQRFGWSKHTDLVKVEQDLMSLLPRDQWLSTSHRIIYHGRAICNARKPACDKCSLAPVCPSEQR